MPELEEINWEAVLPYSIPVITFFAGWFLGRRGSQAQSAARIVKALNRIRDVLVKGS